MYGNVWECRKDWSGNFQKCSTYPTGHVFGSVRVYQGGVGGAKRTFAGPAYRNSRNSSYRNSDTSFLIVFPK